MIRLADKDGAGRHSIVPAIVVGDVERAGVDHPVLLGVLEGHLPLIALHVREYALRRILGSELGTIQLHFLPVLGGVKLIGGHAHVERHEHCRMATEHRQVLRFSHALIQAAQRCRKVSLRHLVMRLCRSEEVEATAEVPLVDHDIAAGVLIRLAAVERRAEVGKLGHPQPIVGVCLA